MSLASATVTAVPVESCGAPPRPWLRLRRAAFPVAAALVVFVASFGVRLVGLDQYSTTDEAYWMQRSIRFGAALARGDLASTYRAGHPGVSVMWTGLLGMGSERAAQYADARFAQYEVLEREPGYLEAFSAARRAVAFVAALLLTVAVLLAVRLLGWGAGLLGGAVLTLDPYVIGMTRLLHVDALLAPLMTVSALAGLVYWTAGCTQGRRWPYLGLSLVTGGLALLTKAPSAYVGIFLGLVCLAGVARGVQRDGLPVGLRRLPRATLPLLLWGTGAGIVYVLLFPAIWVDPLGRVAELIRFVGEVGLQPHDGNFFLGQPVADDPGPFYYLVALPLRASPFVALGVGLLALPRTPAERRTAARWLLVYVVLFAALMTIGAKKFDRYMLPALLMLDVLAGVGLWRLVVVAANRWPRMARRHWMARTGARLASGAGAMMAAVVATQLLLLASVWPYPIAYYNPLAGGADRARQLIMVGWGEGLEQVAAYLNGLPDAESLYVVTSYNHVIRPRFVGTTLAIGPYLREDTSALQPPDYVVLYVNGMQRRQLPPEAVRADAAGLPDFVAYVNGHAYAWVYRVPQDGPRPALPLPVEEDADAQEN